MHLFETETRDSIFARAIALCLCFVDSTSAQPSDEKPEKAFWPREVKISEDIKLEQKTKYGLVTSKRSSGSVVKVISLESDSLKIESDVFQGTMSVGKTDFWDRAEKTRDAAIDRRASGYSQRNGRCGKPRRERRVRESRGMRTLRCFKSRLFKCSMTDAWQVLNDNHKRIFIELRGASLAQGQRYEVRAEQRGTFKYTTVLGAPSTVERWTPLAKP